jgi:outer membrane protein TolC
MLLQDEGTMSLRAVLVACLVCFLLGGAALAAVVENGETKGGEASPELLTVVPPPEAPAELSLQDAVQLALAHNQGFRQSVLSLLNARSNLMVAQQRWGLNLFGTSEHGDAPETGQAGANFSYGALTGGNLTFQSVTNLLAATAGFEGYTALLEQPLLAGRGTASPYYEQLRAARSGYESGVLDYYLSRQDLVVLVIDAYLDAVQQGQFVAIQQESVKLAEQSVQDAELRLKEGLIIQIDLMRAQLRLAQAQSSEVQARQAQQDAIDRLLLLLGVQVEGSPKLVTEVGYEPAPQDVRAAVEYALENRPELRVSDLTIQDREAALRIARSQRLPALNLFGGLEASEFNFSQQAWSVGLQATVPIGARALRETYNQSEWALLVAEQSQEDLQQQIIAEVRRQARAAEAARANVDIAAKAVEVAQESLRLAQRLVEEGLDTNRNVLDAQNDLTAARTTLVTSKNNYYLAMVSLRRAMGMDVGELIPAVTAAPATGAEATPTTANGAAEQPAPAPAESSASPAPAGSDAAGTSAAPEASETVAPAPAEDGAAAPKE